MYKFDLRIIEAVKAREEVFELCIDGIGVLEIYESNLETKYLSEFRNILKYIEYASNGNALPLGKIRKYGGSKDGITEYEYKSKHLRVWAIQQPNKKIVILGGYKNSQGNDEVKFRSLKDLYINSLKQLDNEKKRFIKK